MFKAVKHGKVRFSGSLTAGTWDQVFKLNEDFLTAAVFSRLMYLTPETLAGLLPELGGDLGEVQEAAFWPNWAVSPRSVDASVAQPDIFLRLYNLDLIVEAKVGDSADGQSPYQWARYWAAGYQGDYLMRGRRAMLLGVGGLGDVARDAASVLESEANAYLGSHFPNVPPIRAAGVSWRGLYNRLVNLEADAGAAKSASRALVQDLKEILSYYGHRPLFWLADLREAAAKAHVSKIGQAALGALVAWLERTPEQDWLALQQGLGPISDSSIRVLAEMDYGK
jgi:hypothetical protein